MLHIIYKKKNVMPNLTYKSIKPVPENEGKSTWVTWIHNRRWESYWHDPSIGILPEMHSELSPHEMQRMQGIDIGISLDSFNKMPLYWENNKTKEATAGQMCEWLDDKIKAGQLKHKDACSDSFNSNWNSRALSIGKPPTKGLTFEDFEQVYGLKETKVEGSPYTDMTNNMDIGISDLSLDDYYKRNLLKSKVENRLGGSSNAYTQTYKPLDPNVKPQFFDSTWTLFH